MKKIFNIRKFAALSLFAIPLVCSSLLFVCGCKNLNTTTKNQTTHVSFSISSPEESEGALAKDGHWLIDYAFNDDGQLGYAVITGPAKNEVRGHSGMGGDSNGKVWAYVEKPDGTKISIWNSGRIFFFSGTNFMECPQHISGKTFKAFLNSQPSSYSMSNLLEFAQNHK